MRLPLKQVLASLTLATLTLTLIIGCAGGGNDSDAAAKRRTTTTVEHDHEDHPTTSTTTKPAADVPPPAEGPAVTDPPARDDSPLPGVPPPGAPTGPDHAGLAAGPTLAASGPSGSGCSPGSGPTLPDGWWAGTVTAIDGPTIEWDVVCWFDEPAALAAASEDGVPAEALSHPRYIRNTDPTTYPLTFPSRTAPATLAATSMNDAKGTFPGTIGDVIDLYTPNRDDMSTLRTPNGEAQYLDELWIHISGGVPDYVYMQFSC